MPINMPKISTKKSRRTLKIKKEIYNKIRWKIF